MIVWDVSDRSTLKEINPNLYKDAKSRVRGQDAHHYGDSMATRNRSKGREHCNECFPFFCKNLWWHTIENSILLCWLWNEN